MITLYTFGPYFGLPDGSPFVMKAMLLLKLASLPYREDRGGYLKAPKGKLPYIDDRGTIVADSTFIRLHLESAHGIDFDAGLDARERGIAWSVEKMCEEYLYFALVDARWGRDENFAKGPARFFDTIPTPVRPIVSALVRRKTLRRLKAQGVGGHSRPEIERLAIRDLDAISAVLGDKPYLLGERPCGADAAVFGMVAGLLAPTFETPIRQHAEGLPNLTAYAERIRSGYFADAETGTP